MSRLSRTLLLATAASGLLAAAPAAAQDRYERAAYEGPTERVEVTAPPYRSRDRSDIGAPIEDVALSREVSFGDLDLTTRFGVRELRARVRDTARNLCSKLKVRYPLETSDSPPCYQTAVAGAMEQVDDAIARARNE